MLLLNVVTKKGEVFIDVQNGDKSYRSCSLKGHTIEAYCRDVVIAMLASAGVPAPLLNSAIPEAVELPKPLKDGIGLSDDHKKLILMKGGKETVVEEGPRYLIARSLMLQVGRSVADGRHLKGDWS